MVNLTGSLGTRLDGVKRLIVEAEFPPFYFLTDLKGVGFGLKLCFFSIEVCTRSLEREGMFLEILCRPVVAVLITAGVLRNVLIICFL